MKIQDSRVKKAIEYACPTSPNATAWGFKNGVWYVSVWTRENGKRFRILGKFATKEKAVELAESLAYPYHKYSLH